MSFGQNILRYRESIIKDISELIKIKSYTAFDENSYEYSKESKEALKWMINKAQYMGFKTVNVEDIAGHAQYGTGNKISAVLTHVDVVPAGTGWNSDPFKLTKKNGKLFGRGIVDNKGSAVISLYCLKALKDLNIKGNNQVRSIFGAGEETGKSDMVKYFAQEPLPQIAFTPDSEYGICNREKGILHIKLSLKSYDGIILTNFNSGISINSVPDQAKALLNCTEQEDHQLQRLADAKKGMYKIEYTPDGIMVICSGKAAHAATPECGLNSASYLIRLLASNFGHKAIGSLCSFLDSAIGLEIYGSSMGIKRNDKYSGDLTVNLGKVNINSNKCIALIDVRYPVTDNGKEIFEIIKNNAKRSQISAELIGYQEPLFLKDDLPLITLLKNAYKNITGNEANLYCTGGGTYARSLNNRGVAFGPTFEGGISNIHDSNENVDEEKLMLHAQICLEAMYQMFIS